MERICCTNVERWSAPPRGEEVRVELDGALPLLLRFLAEGHPAEHAAGGCSLAVGVAEAMVVRGVIGREGDGSFQKFGGFVRIAVSDRIATRLHERFGVARLRGDRESQEKHQYDSFHEFLQWNGRVGIANLRSAAIEMLVRGRCVASQPCFTGEGAPATTSASS